LEKRQELFQLVRPDQWDIRRAIQAENQKNAQPVFQEAERFARENRKPQQPYQFPQKGRIPSEFKSPISPLHPEEYNARRVAQNLDRGASVPHLINEGMTDLSSTDQRRNVRILSLLDDYRKEEKPATIVIFFYGEEHLEPVKLELIKSQPTGTNIRWTLT